MLPSQGSDIMKKSKLIDNLLLLIFILLFVGLFQYAFGSQIVYVSAFAITAILMFAKIDLKLPVKKASITLAILFPLSVIFPYLINLSQNVLVGIFIILVSIFIFLVPLAPTLRYQSYLPFLFLYAINTNTKMVDFNKMLAASIVAGLIIAVVYYFNHRDKKHESMHIVIHEGFVENYSFIIKVSLGMILAYVVGYYLNSVKTSWIILTVISLTEVSLDYTYEKTWKRVLATVLGSVVYTFFLIKVVSKHADLVPLLLIVISYIYTFIDNYFVKMIFVTFNAINASVMNNQLPSVMVINSRIIFIIIGAVIALLIGYMYHLGNKKA